MDAVAEICLSGALLAVEEKLEVPVRCIFDLIAWSGRSAPKLDTAVQTAGLDIKELRLIPIIPTPKGEKWSTIEEVSIWPDVSFALLKPREFVKHVGIHLTSLELDSQRHDRLRGLAARIWGGRRLAIFAIAISR